MSFSRVNPLGWALFEELTSAQMNQLDIDHANAIDGVDGGTYTLNNPLTINGTVIISDLQADATLGDLTVTGTFVFNGTTIDLQPTVSYQLIAPLVTIHGTSNASNAVDIRATGASGGIYVEGGGAATGVQIRAPLSGIYIQSGTSMQVFADTSVRVQGGTSAQLVAMANRVEVLASGVGGGIDLITTTGDISLYAGTDIDFTWGSGGTMTFTAAGASLIDMSAVGGLLLPGGTTKDSGAFIEYASPLTMEKFFSPVAIGQEDSLSQWDVIIQSVQVTSYGAASHYMMVPLPRRAIGVAVRVFFEADTVPGATGLTVELYYVDGTTGSPTYRNQIGVAEVQPLGSHVGQNILTTVGQGYLAIAGSSSYLVIRLISPVGGAGVNLEVQKIGVDCQLAGMGSW